MQFCIQLHIDIMQIIPYLQANPYQLRTKNIITIVDKIFEDILILYQIFFSSQVKRSMIVSNKHSIYKLPHELLNDFRLRILRNWESSGKSQNFIELQPSAQSSHQTQFSLDTSSKMLKNIN